MSRARIRLVCREDAEYAARELARLNGRPYVVEYEDASGCWIVRPAP